MKKGFLLGSILAAICCLCLTTVFAGAKIKTKGLTPEKAVEFDHETHGKNYKCSLCHHKAKDEKPEAPKTCASAGCHDRTDKDMKKDTSEPERLSSKGAYHQNCFKDCHKKEKKGPTKCNECHPKK